MRRPPRSTRTDTLVPYNTRCRSTGKAQVQPRLSLGEPASVHLAALSEEDQEVDQLSIRVSDRWPLNQRSVDKFEHHVVVPSDDDVLDRKSTRLNSSH